MLQIVFAFAGTKTVEGKLEYAFGLNNGLPWGHIKQDLQNFKNRTAGTNLLMGAKTFMSLPGKLPGRPHIVVQDFSRPYVRNKKGEQADMYISPKEFTRLISGEEVQAHQWFYDVNTILSLKDGEYSVIGGPGLIQEALPFADKIICTSIRKSHRINSDVQIPFSMLMDIFKNNELIETHYYKIDELTSISEDVYVRKNGL